MKVYTLHWSIHPEKTLEWYEHEKTRLTPDEMAREHDINYALSVSGKVFSSFDDKRHVIRGKHKHNPHRSVYRIWDFGKTNAVIYAQIDSFGRKTILHERVLGNPEDNEDPSDTTEQIAVALRDSENLFKNSHFEDICDPAGSYDDGRGLSTHVDLLNAEGIYPRFESIKALPTKERKRRGLEMIKKDLQQTPGGKEAFKLWLGGEDKPGCPLLLRAMQGSYRYKRDNFGNQLDRIHEAHPFEDVVDCLIYLYLETDLASGESNEVDYTPYMDDGGNDFFGY